MSPLGNLLQYSESLFIPALTQCAGPGNQGLLGSVFRTAPSLGRHPPFPGLRRPCLPRKAVPAGGNCRPRRSRCAFALARRLLRRRTQGQHATRRQALTLEQSASIHPAQRPLRPPPRRPWRVIARRRPRWRLLSRRQPGIEHKQQLPGAQRGPLHPVDAHPQRLLDRAAVVVAAACAGQAARRRWPPGRCCWEPACPRRSFLRAMSGS